MSLQIITAHDAAFRPMVEKTLEANQRLGYVVDHWPLVSTIIPETPSLAIESWSPKSSWKPKLIQAAMRVSHFRRTLVWMDADAWCIRPIDEVDTGDYDVAVTMRGQDERMSYRWPEIFGFLNAGFIVIRPTIGAAKFLDKWVEQTRTVYSRSDQHALNNVVRQFTDLREYNKVFEFDGMRVKILSCEEYNWIYLPTEPKPFTKVLHAKKDVREKIDLEAWTSRKFA
jgi:hypothetical protein